jgi:DNA modification methylase
MTELIWDGKYKDGKKVAPVRIALPFQTIETVNESKADRDKRLGSLFNQKEEAGEWRNRLIWGDKKYVLPSLLPEFAGKVNLIYIDPPFNVGSDFSFTATIADHPDTDEDETTTFVKQPSIIEQKAYRDTWGKGLDSYMQWFYETAVLLRELLAEDGSIYVHLDWHVCHYAKTILDEVFGYENFKNEVVWYYRRWTAGSSSYQRMHDVILYYSKGDKYTFNKTYVEPTEGQKVKHLKGWDRNTAKIGGRRQPQLLVYDQAKVDLAVKEGRINLKEFARVVQVNVTETIAPDVWEINFINSQSQERVEYSTQKPEALLERIIKASSNEGDLVLDCFCGSGTTAATAEKNNRRWITCDLGRFAIHTARKRFLGIANVKPFIVQNLGKYERQQWIKAEFENAENRLQQEKTYKHFINELYHAKPLDGYTWIHGAKAGRMIHVGSVETPVTVDDIKATILEFWKLVGKEKSTTTNGIDFLGWDFAFDVNETAAQFAASNKVDVKFKKIPREVLEKKAVEQGDIKFYELASLKLKSKIDKKKLSITLDNFIIPPDDIPEDVRGSITHWSQWIDYWAVDWNYRDDTFHNEWQSYRTKQNPKIELTANNLYEAKGKFTVLVKVIDILGNDTTKGLEIGI